MSKVVVIGAGVAGLSAGVYARLAGFDVDVFEAHALAGGLCTTWRRQGFAFDGCIHYLLGTRPESPFHRLWEEVGAVQGREFVYPEALATATDRDGRVATLHCDPARLEAHLCDLSPRDEVPARRLCRLVTALPEVLAPLDKAAELWGPLDVVRLLWRQRGIAADLAFCLETSLAQYAARFRDPLLRQLLLGTMDPRSPLLNLVATLGALARRQAGYPIGGSLPFARAIQARLERLGGRLHCGRRVARVAVRGGRATGIELEEGTAVEADFVLAACDLRTTLDALLGGRFPSPAHERLFREAPLSAPAVQVSFGLGRRLAPAAYVVASQLELGQPLPVPGGALSWLGWSRHDHDPTLAPAGGAVVTALLPAEWRSWEALGDEPSAYAEAKEALARRVAGALEGPLPGLSAAIQAVDVATPLTYRRYTGNHQGAYMTWLGEAQRRPIPKEIPGLDRLLLCGMWVAAPGGLPPAVKSARDAVQILCKRERVPFHPAP